ncbi:MAG TPA: type II toxin-antitoxin system MqsR family toxin [Longimicrobium sp.]|jgi:hypothetical protein
MGSSRARSTHDLATIQYLVARMRYRVYEDPSEYTVLGLDQHDIREVVALLTPAHAQKTMPSSKSPGAMQDVYRVRYEGIPLYIKFDLSRDPRTGEPRLAIILSFKRDTSP